MRPTNVHMLTAYTEVMKAHARTGRLKGYSSSTMEYLEKNFKKAFFAEPVFTSFIMDHLMEEHPFVLRLNQVLSDKRMPLRELAPNPVDEVSLTDDEDD